MSDSDIRCIICGNIKPGSDEHIIPKSLGNEVLRMNMVCKVCNEGLGRYVDEHLVNNLLSQIIRQQLNLKGQSKKMPNPFAKGKDLDGREIHINDEFKPSLPLRLEQNGDIVTTVGGTQEQAEKALKAKLARMGKTEPEIQELLNNAERKVECYQPKVSYSCEINIDKLLLGALKIAYEYMYLTFGEQFYEDKVGQEIREVLYEATLGKFNKKYSEMQLMPKHIKDIYTPSNDIYPNAHILSLVKDTANQLVLNISLFGCEALSFSVCVSKDASKYNLDKNTLVIIDIVEQQKISF
ncbi:HNH endonuclease [Clostridioides difficile]|uniref:HNH endonuclease n=1 Tax=Clostridioides difficile TaxID=1496 RepID=UPI000D1DDAAA|nr:HNH endonuclease [Clostridioides difficile]